MSNKHQPIIRLVLLRFSTFKCVIIIYNINNWRCKWINEPKLYSVLRKLSWYRIHVHYRNFLSTYYEMEVQKRKGAVRSRKNLSISNSILIWFIQKWIQLGSSSRISSQSMFSLCIIYKYFFTNICNIKMQTNRVNLFC